MSQEGPLQFTEEELHMILGRGSQPTVEQQSKNTLPMLTPGNGSFKFNYSLEEKVDPECVVCKMAGRAEFKSHTSTSCPNRGKDNASLGGGSGGAK